MRYLKSFNEVVCPESELFNIILEAINDTFIDNTNQLHEEFVDRDTKDLQVRYVFNLLSDDDKKDLGRTFLKKYLLGKKSNLLFEFLHDEFKKTDTKMSKFINDVWHFE